MVIVGGNRYNPLFYPPPHGEVKGLQSFYKVLL